MDIKTFLKKTIVFLNKRLIEILGLILMILSIFLLGCLLTYSPEDPNFILENKNEIKNFFGLRGSYTSDLILQSFGLISFLLPFTLLFNAVTVIKSKEIIFLIETFFFSILYILVGSLFFSVYYDNSYFLSLNGNGGITGNYLKNIISIDLLNENNKILYYSIILLILTFFLLSLKFKIKFILNIIKIFITKKNKDTNNQDITVIEQESLIRTSDVVKNNPIQEDLPFNEKSNLNKYIKKFKLPKIDILNLPKKNEREKQDNEKIDNAFLEKILLDFGVEGKIKKISHGPVVTLNEFEPAPGVKVSKIINLAEDIARNTSSESARISMIPGSNTIGIELPNLTRENVYLREIVSNSNFLRKENKLPIALGKSISGVPIIGDLSSMPHLLIAGTTGSGKSVCINTIILSLIYKHRPDMCKFILIDPKMLELSTYEGIPHLLCPVITEAKRAASVLGWVVKEMESRYKLMTKEGVRNIDGYNSKHKLPMPYIVVIVDEMSDLMHVAGKEIESYIQKLSQMARASGIHIIMATQRPSVDVITGTIKANFPTRISFQVTSKIDSRTILGEQGAEQLLGKGDMLYMSSANRIIRIHAPFVSDEEIEKVNNFVRSQEEPNYVDEILNFADEKEGVSPTTGEDDQDELYQTALDIIKHEGKASTSFLQRKLQIGYNRAARIIDMMEEKGEVSKANHVGKREVLK